MGMRMEAQVWVQDLGLCRLPSHPSCIAPRPVLLRTSAKGVLGLQRQESRAAGRQLE